MKIQRFVLAGVVAFFLVVAGLSGGFYNIQKTTTLLYLISSLNQNVFKLESSLRKSLSENDFDNVQRALDEAAAIDDAVSVYSISFDDRTIAVSSSRTLCGKAVDAGTYRPIVQLRSGLLSQHQLHYQTRLHYFPGNDRKEAVLLIDLNREFVFGRLNQIAVFIAATLFAVLALFALGTFGAARRWLVSPLEEITLFSRTQNDNRKGYFIEELAVLKRTLAETFSTMQIQQGHLKEALDEARYLDRMLRTVADVNQFLLTAKDVNELLGHTCNRLAADPAYDVVLISVLEGGELTVRAHSADPTGLLFMGMKTTLGEGSDLADPSVRAIREGGSVAVDHMDRSGGWGSWRFVAEKGEYGSMVAIPLISSSDSPPLGVMTLYAKRSEGFEPKEMTMLEELAGDVGFAYESFLQRERFRYHMTTDGATNLPNRYSLVEALSQSDICALAIVNIDRFSDINEVYGIAIGDAILSGYGHWLSTQVASIRDHAELFKLSGDEYALIYRNCLELGRFVTFLEELIASTQKESFMIDEVEIVLTVTVGVSPASDRMLEHANAALKQAKRKRHSLEVFSFASKEEQENNIAWYKRIKEAIEESRIVPYFQPIVDNTTRKVVKYEALIRLIERDGTVVSPYLFLEIAKKTKLYPELTKIMIQKVVERFRSRSVPVSLNLSTQDLLNPELADYLETMICANGMGRLIIFEILESEGIGNYTEVTRFVDRFKAIGCRFAIDDFGSGYSNFDHLLKLNIDTLKIDGGLIRSLPHDRNAQIFVKHISDFAHEMGISTVAEFVANEGIFQQVCEIGIDASQGYYFYEPSADLVAE